MQSQRRSITLIQPRLQLRLVAGFVLLSAIGLLLQYILLLGVLSRAAARLPNDGLRLMDELSGILGQFFLISACLLLPVTLVVGVLCTHRVAGPVYRLKTFLLQVVRGEQPADCRLRKGDELLDLCELINQATASARGAAGAAATPTTSQQRALDSQQAPPSPEPLRAAS